MTSDPSSCELKQGGAGFETVWEAFPVSNGSKKYECMWYWVLEYSTKKLRFLVTVMILSNKSIFDFVKLY